MKTSQQQHILAAALHLDEIVHRYIVADLLIQQHRGLVCPAPSYISDVVPTATHHQRRHLENITITS